MTNTPLRDHLTGFHRFLCKKGRAPATVESYLRDAKHFVHFTDIHNLAICQIDFDMLTAFQDYLAQEKNQLNSIRRKVIGTKQFLRYLSTLDEKPLGECELSPIPPRRELASPVFPSKFFPNLLTMAKKTSHHAKMNRDTLILHLLGLEGLKATEICALKWSYHIASKTLGSLKVSGKSRTIELHPETQAHLLVYKQALTKLHPIQANDHMMVAFKGKQSHTVLPKLTRHGLKFLLYEISKPFAKPVNSEILRHHAMEFQILLGKSPEEIMMHMGLRQLGNLTKHLLDRKKNTP